MNKRPHTFRKTRAENLAESAEDYTELVLELITECGEARVTELARRLGISHVSALRTVKRLTTAGLLSSGNRRPIELTRKGHKLALEARKKHQTLVTFLERLGVPRRFAESDAEGIEHHVSRATMQAIQRWMKKFALLALFLSSLTVSAYAAAPGQCETVARLVPRVSELRQLPTLEPVRCREISPADFRLFKERQFLEAVTPALLEREELTFKLLGIIPENYPYARCIAQSNSSDVMATYDADSRTILLPAGLPIPEEIIAHEIAHALQDQHFDLKRIQAKANRHTDSALALSALCEGDALQLQEWYRDKFQPAPQDESSAQKAPPHPQDDCTLPELLDRQNGFPYERGLRFIQLLAEARGPGAVNQAFKSPPHTTHEILSPTDYPLDPLTQEFTLLPTDESLGEYTLFLMLRQQLPLNRAILAAKGWRGDRARLSSGSRNQRLSWASSWGTIEDAADFFAAFNSVLSARHGVSLDAQVTRFQVSPREGLKIEGKRNGRLISYSFSLDSPPLARK